MSILDEDFFDEPIEHGAEFMPVKRVIDKLNEYENRGDLDGAIKHLRYWIAEANRAGDLKSEFTFNNEIMGMYRITGREEEAIRAAEETLKIAETINIFGSEAYGTALLNAATVYKAFGKSDKALPLFRSAEEILIGLLSSNHAKIGGLYNNMALCLTDLDMFDEAEKAYKKAIDIMLTNKNGQLEAAISWLNLANLYEKRDGLLDADEIIAECLDKAEALLEDKTLPRNGYYAFVCDKCAPTFGYYGRFVYAERKAKEAKEIYERY